MWQKKILQSILLSRSLSFKTLFLPSTSTSSSNFFRKILPKEKEEKRLNPILLTKRNIDKYCHHGYWPLIHVRIRNWNDAWTITPTVSEYASFREEKVSVVSIRNYVLKVHWRSLEIFPDSHKSPQWNVTIIKPILCEKRLSEFVGRSLNGQF